MTVLDPATAFLPSIDHISTANLPSLESSDGSDTVICRLAFDGETAYTAVMTYFGSKNGAGVKERIIGAQGPHDTYIELFLGSGAVLNAKAPAMRQIGVEANIKTIKAHKYVDGAEIIHGCAFEFIERFEWLLAGRVVVFVDPPYVARTRRGGGEYGRYELSDAEHKFLCFKLKQIAELYDVQVILSGYDNPIYREHLKGFHRIDYQTSTHAGVVTESLWLSRVAAKPHWHTFYGRDRRHRRDLKVKADRWAANYISMDQGERMAVIAAMFRAEIEAEITADDG